MNFFYSSGAMGYGWGQQWHKFFNFPTFPIVTKTITLEKKRGYPLAIIQIGSTIYNHVALHNFGISRWLDDCKIYSINTGIIVSIAGSDSEIQDMIHILETMCPIQIWGIELNFSCPNVPTHSNKSIPHSVTPLYLKLNHLQDPYNYELDRIEGIRMNSIPCRFGGMSGKGAQKYNWKYIKKFNKEGLNIAGCSFLSNDDIKYLHEYCGCNEFGIGSTILINPRLIESLIKYDKKV